PDPDFLLPLGSRYLGIVPMELFDKGLVARQAIGTGPMIMTRADAAAGVSYKKNPDFFKGNIWVDGMEMSINTDPAPRRAAFRLGQLDYLDRTVYTLRDAKALLASNPNVRIQLENLIGGIGGVLAWNLSNPKFQDERIRQA